MNGKKWIAFLLAGCLVTALPGCGSKEDAVFVQSVQSLMQMGGIAPGDRFAGLVVSENVTEIQKDKDKVVEELLVREGDDVKMGQKLFSYDTEQLQLTLEKQQLEKEQLEASIVNFEEQIAQMERERQWAGVRDKLELTIQIQTNQVDLKEAQLNLKTKEAEVVKSQNLLENSTVTAPVDGRVTSISESGTDNNGRELPYITIQQAGSYRVKGTINELQRGAVREGDRVRLESRTDSSQFWMGTVKVVDYENPSQSNNNNMYYMESDEMTSSSKYPFYVELDSTEGMLLGQHLYISLDAGGEGSSSGLSLGSAFVCFDENGETYVWADSGRGKLEKRTVTLGEYNADRDTYEILSGLTEADYVAFPDPELCRNGVPTTKVQTESAQSEGGVA